MAADLALLTMASSDGDPIVADPGSVRALFSGMSHAWPCRGTLDPGKYLKVGLAQSPTSGGTLGKWQCSVHIGVHGEYEVSLG